MDEILPGKFVPASVSGWTNELDVLFDEAISRFGVSCLWNIPRVRSRDGLLSILEMLREYGDMDARRLAERIRTAMANATG